MTEENENKMESCIEAVYSCDRCGTTFMVNVRERNTVVGGQDDDGEDFREPISIICPLCVSIHIELYESEKCDDKEIDGDYITVDEEMVKKIRKAVNKI